MSKKIVKDFLNNELKAVPQQDPVWFESLEYEDGSFTMDIEDILNRLSNYSQKKLVDALLQIINDDGSDYKYDFIIDIIEEMEGVSDE